jgi:hypothetical protein
LTSVAAWISSGANCGSRDDVATEERALRLLLLALDIVQNPKCQEVLATSNSHWKEGPFLTHIQHNYRAGEALSGNEPFSHVRPCRLSLTIAISRMVKDDMANRRLANFRMICIRHASMFQTDRRLDSGDLPQAFCTDCLPMIYFWQADIVLIGVLDSGVSRSSDHSSLQLARRGLRRGRF